MGSFNYISFWGFVMMVFTLGSAMQYMPEEPVMVQTEENPGLVGDMETLKNLQEQRRLEEMYEEEQSATFQQQPDELAYVQQEREQESYHQVASQSNPGSAYTGMDPYLHSRGAEPHHHSRNPAVELLSHSRTPAVEPHLHSRIPAGEHSRIVTTEPHLHSRISPAEAQPRIPAEGHPNSRIPPVAGSRYVGLSPLLPYPTASDLEAFSREVVEDKKEKTEKKKDVGLRGAARQGYDDGEEGFYNEAIAHTTKDFELHRLGQSQPVQFRGFDGYKSHETANKKASTRYTHTESSYDDDSYIYKNVRVEVEGSKEMQFPYNYRGFPYNYMGWPYNQRRYVAAAPSPYVPAHKPAVNIVKPAASKKTSTNYLKSLAPDYNCPDTGLYYRSETSFFNCHNGEAIIQRCAEGTRNKHRKHYEDSAKSSFSDFCSVNDLAGRH